MKSMCTKTEIYSKNFLLHIWSMLHSDVKTSDCQMLWVCGSITYTYWVTSYHIKTFSLPSSVAKGQEKLKVTMFISFIKLAQYSYYLPVSTAPTPAVITLYYNIWLLKIHWGCYFIASYACVWISVHNLCHGLIYTTAKLTLIFS